MTPQDLASPAMPSHDPVLRGAGGWGRPLMEEDLAVLARLRDAAIAVAEATSRRAVREEARRADLEEANPDGPIEPPAPSPQSHGGDPVLRFARASRVVHSAITLRTQLIDDLERLDNLQEGRAKWRARDLREQRKSQIAGVLTRILDAETAAAFEDEDFGDEDDAAERLEAERETYQLLAREVTASLTDPDRFGDVLARPISAFIDHVCRDIGLTPDWQRLARESWARDEMAGGEVGAPLAAAQQDAACATPPSRAVGSGVRAAAERIRRSRAKRRAPPPPPPPENAKLAEILREAETDPNTMVIRIPPLPAETAAARPAPPPPPQSSPPPHPAPYRPPDEGGPRHEGPWPMHGRPPEPEPQGLPGELPPPGRRRRPYIQPESLW